jgi:hypothetical protein
MHAQRLSVRRLYVTSGDGGQKVIGKDQEKEDRRSREEEAYVG